MKTRGILRGANPEAEAQAITDEACKPHKPAGRKKKPSAPKPKNNDNRNNEVSRRLLGNENTASSHIEPSAPSSAPNQAPNPMKFNPEPAVATVASKPSPAYTINIKAFYDEKSVMTSVKSSLTFDYVEFNTKSIDKLNEAAGNGDLIGHRRVAVISSSAPKGNAEQDLDDEDAWGEVNNIAKQWLQDKRKNVTVDITLQYGSRPAGEPVEPELSSRKKRRYSVENSDSSSSSTSESDSEAISTSSESDDPASRKRARKGKKVKRGKGSVTAKQIKAAKARKKLDKRLGKQGLKLMRRWRCDKEGCKTRTKHCWQPWGENGAHYNLHQEFIDEWLQDIARKDATVEKPSAELKSKLFGYMEAQKNRSRPKDKDENSTTTPVEAAPISPQKSLNATSNQSPVGPAMSPYYSHMQSPYMQANQQPYFMQQPICYSPFAQMSPQTPSQFHQQQPSNIKPPAPQPSPPPVVVSLSRRSRPTTADGHPPPAPSSSPLRLPNRSRCELLEAYMLWQIEHCPDEEEELQYAFEQLDRGMHTLKQVRRFKVSDWKDYDIPRGLGDRLQDEIKDFLRAFAAEEPTPNQQDGLTALAQAAEAAEHAGREG